MRRTGTRARARARRRRSASGALVGDEARVHIQTRGPGDLTTANRNRNPPAGPGASDPRRRRDGATSFGVLRLASSSASPRLRARRGAARRSFGPRFLPAGSGSSPAGCSSPASSPPRSSSARVSACPRVSPPLPPAPPPRTRVPPSRLPPPPPPRVLRASPPPPLLLRGLRTRNNVLLLSPRPFKRALGSFLLLLREHPVPAQDEPPRPRRWSSSGASFEQHLVLPQPRLVHRVHRRARARGACNASARGCAAGGRAANGAEGEEEGPAQDRTRPGRARQHQAREPLGGRRERRERVVAGVNVSKPTGRFRRGGGRGGGGGGRRRGRRHLPRQGRRHLLRRAPAPGAGAFGPPSPPASPPPGSSSPSSPSSPSAASAASALSLASMSSPRLAVAIATRASSERFIILKCRTRGLRFPSPACAATRARRQATAPLGGRRAPRRRAARRRAAARRRRSRSRGASPGHRTAGARRARLLVEVRLAPTRRGCLATTRTTCSKLAATFFSCANAVLASNVAEPAQSRSTISSASAPLRFIRAMSSWVRACALWSLRSKIVSLLR